jgi:hypothetical protein
MSLRDWILWIVGTGVSLVALILAVFQYFNRLRRPKIEVVRRTLLVSCGLLLATFLIGLVTIVEFSSPKEATEHGRLDLPPHLELSLEFPAPEQFPANNAPLTKTVTELYLWKNNGGPIYHSKAQTIDEIEAVAGRCREMDSMKTRIIPLLNNPNHQAAPITKNMIEMPFFISPKADYFKLLDRAVYGIEFDANDNPLQAKFKAFETYLNKLGLCGSMRRRDVLVKFDFVDIHNRTTSLFYRFPNIPPFETLSETDWAEVMNRIPDPERLSGYTPGDIAEPCRVLGYVQGGKLLDGCKVPSP